MSTKRIFIFFIVLTSAISSKGQFNNIYKNGLAIETSVGYGFIMPHHKSIEYNLEEHIRTFDLKISKITYGNRYWNQLYKYPYYGIGYYRSNLANDKVYGYVNALYTYIKVPFLGESDQANLSWQIAFGGSYITKYFDIETNPQNLAIASNLNMYIDFSVQSKIPISERLSLNNGIRFTHVSNGRVKSPNKGLNILSGSVGLLYHINQPKKRIKHEITAVSDEVDYTLIYAGGIKTKTRYEPGYYYASSLIFDYNMNYSQKARWSLGTDVFFDGTNRKFSDKNEKADIANSDLYQIGLHAGHDIVIGRLSLVINVGGYIFAPVEVLAPIYSRIGLRYRIKDKFILNYTLKSHWAKASFLEWGIGYVF